MYNLKLLILLKTLISRSKANKFLESLAMQTGGRYHRYRSDSKALQLAPKLQTMELEEIDVCSKNNLLISFI